MTPEQYASSYTYSTLLNYSRGVVTDAKIFTQNMRIWLRDRTWEKGWYDEVKGVEKSSPTLTDFITKPAPNGLGSTVAWVWATLETAKQLGVGSAAETRDLFLSEIPDAQELLEAEIRKSQPPLLEQAKGGRGKKTPTNSRGLSSGSTRADVTLGRLKRDHPELAAKVVSGELSANAAAIEAGFRRKPSALENLNRAWAKATEDERRAFLAGVDWPG